MVRAAVRVDDGPATGTRRRRGRARGASTGPSGSRDALEGTRSAGVPEMSSRRALAARASLASHRDISAHVILKRWRRGLSAIESVAFSARVSETDAPREPLADLQWHSPLFSVFAHAEPLGVALRARRLQRARPLAPPLARQGARLLACLLDWLLD